MEKSRKDKGITLIALIITIIVLLILALVTINAIQGDGDLIAHANNAKTLYAQAGENENAFVQNSLEKIKKYLNDDTKQDEKEQVSFYKGDLYIIKLNKESNAIMDTYIITGNNTLTHISYNGIFTKYTGETKLIGNLTIMEDDLVITEGRSNYIGMVFKNNTLYAYDDGKENKWNIFNEDTTINLNNYIITEQQ